MANFKRNFRSWTGNPNFQPEHCVVAVGKPDTSRFYPANDLGRLLPRLRDVNEDGASRQTKTGMVMRIHPDDADMLTKAADALAGQTVFISYKYRDFDGGDTKNRPRWQPAELAEFLIRRGFGVWFDSLCAPRRRGAGGKERSQSTLTEDELGRLLAEGYLQSQVVLAIATPRYATPGIDGKNWTQREYSGRFRLVIGGHTHPAEQVPAMSEGADLPVSRGEW